VHCLKDLPTVLPDGSVLRIHALSDCNLSHCQRCRIITAAMLERGDVADAIIFSPSLRSTPSLDALPPGSARDLARCGATDCGTSTVTSAVGHRHLVDPPHGDARAAIPSPRVLGRPRQP
jgi:hypothetical protein